MKRQTEVVVSFESRSKGPDGEEYFGYEVRGDGAVVRKFMDPEGINVSAAVRDAADVELAQQTFGHIRDNTPS